MKKMNPMPLNAVKLQDNILSRMIELNSKEVIPYSIQRCEETGRVEAFRLNWKPGMPKEPHVYWDSDFAKVIEGLALDLINNPDSKKEKQLDDYVELIISAQQPDGYLNTHFTVVDPANRWTRLYIWHELYCAGHLMEAAVAHFQATGKRNFLDAMCRFADYIASVFGTEEGKLKGYPGHEEIELALCKLADASGQKKYADLAKYFIDQRGQEPNYFKMEFERAKATLPENYERQLQADRPVREQHDVQGHSVRAMYLYSGMAEVAERYNDNELLDVCKDLFDSAVERNMYVTGGIGSTEHGERFTRDYHLPNATAYAESCASIALVLFSMRMLNITKDAKYADAMETAVFNGAASGLGLSGREFFYANMLEVEGELYVKRDNIAVKRQPWFNCSCCPTNYCRYLAQLPSIAYSSLPDGVAVNIPVDANINLKLDGGKALKLAVSGNYPYGNSYAITVEEGCPNAEIDVRIPGWAEGVYLKLNGELLNEKMQDGFCCIKRDWIAGDKIEVAYDAKVRCLHADPRVSDDAGKVALAFGPVIYALESVDNGDNLSEIIIPEEQDFTLSQIQGLPAGTMAIHGIGFRETTAEPGKLYSTKKPLRTACEFTAIPFALWQNRGNSTMRVWIRSL